MTRPPDLSTLTSEEKDALIVALLERVASKLAEFAPDHRIAAEFTLARALWDSGGDHTRASALASHALAATHERAGASRGDGAQIQQWLARHSAN